MSHELTLNKLTGLVEMGYAPGVDRWHGLGNEWLENDSMSDRIRKSGMEWTAKRSRVRYGDGPAQRIINDQHVLFRSDTKEPLGIVSDKYQIVQPREALEFFTDLADGNGFTMKTAGTLYGGKKFWATAAIGADAVIISPDDVMEGFLLFSSSLDGSSGTKVRDTTICVVCDNTLRMAMEEKAKREVNITHRARFDAAAVKAQLGLATGNFKASVQAARALAKKAMGDQAAQDFIAGLLVTNAAANLERIDKGEHAGFNKIMALFNGEGKGSQLPGRAGTVWGAVNAVTEYVDHHQKAASAENRMANALWGEGNTFKVRTLEAGLALL